MLITVNGEQKSLEQPISLLEFLQQKGINPGKVVVEHNYQIVKTENWAQLILQENDNLEILAFVGGG